MEMHLIISSGIAATEGILLLAEEERDARLREALNLVHENLDAGMTFSRAMEAVGTFPKYMVEMISIGEKTGNLDSVFISLSEYYKRQQRVAQTIKTAVAYPLMLFFMVIIVVAVLLMEVLPIFNDVFAQLGTNMQPMAVWFMNVGIALRHGRVAILICVGAAAGFAMLVYLIEPLRKSLGGFAMSVISKGALGKKIGMAQFSFAMAMTLSSGMDLDSSLEMAKNLVSQENIKIKIDKCRALIDGGAAFSDAVKEADIFEPIYCRMIAVGIKTGATDSVMSEIARRSEENMEIAIERTIAKVEPALVIVMSVTIGIVLLAVMLPLMGVMSAIG